MKLRRLSVFIALFGIPAVLLLGSYVRNLVSEESGNVIKNQYSSESTPKNAVSKLKDLLSKPTSSSPEFTERKDFDESIIATERLYTEAEINNMTEAEFVELVKTTDLKLPKLSDLKELPPGALHMTPAPVIQAGRDLGLLKEILKTHESYEKLALGFYEKCARNIERPTPVRALCLTNLVEIKKKNGEKINIKEYPAPLVELTKMITDL